MKKLLPLTKSYVLVFFSLLFNSYYLAGQEPGNALDFDGSNDYVQIGTFWQGGQDCGYSGCKDGDLFLYLKDYSIEVWIKPADVDGVTNQYEAVVANGISTSQLAWSIFINRSGFASFKWFDQNTGTIKEIKTPTGSIINNRWQHIAINKSGTTLKIFINGEQQTTAGDDFTEGYQNSGKVVLLGNAPYTSSSFKGQIDEFHIWKSEAVLPNLYNVVGGGANLWCNLRFNYSAGTLISSISSISNYFPSNGVMYYMDGITDWVESYAMVVPRITAPANNANGSFTANWTAPEVGTVEKYYLEIATDAAMTNKVQAYSPYVDVGNVLSYTLSGLTQGQTYYYRLRAFKSSVGDVGAYTPVSSIIINSSEPGNALDFDGINDYVQIGTSWQGQRVWNASTSTWKYGDLYFYNAPFTIEAWIKPSDVDGATNQYEAIVVNGNASNQLQYSIFINRAGFVSYRWYDQNTSSMKELRTAPGTIINNRWQHVAIAKGGSTLYIFINGVQQTMAGNPLTEGTVEGGSVLLGASVNTSMPFKGQIDEFHVWKNQVRPPTLFNVVGGDPYLYCNYRFNILEGNNVSSISSVTNSYPSNGVMYNMEGNADRVESYAMVRPNVSAATNNECGRFTASWTAPVRGTAEKYYLEIATDPSMNNKVPAYSPSVDVGNVLSYEVTGLNYQTYYYRLRAFKASVGDVGNYTPVYSVNIVDATKPVVVTRDVTVILDPAGNGVITPELINNGSSDNCAINTLSLDKTSFNCTNIGVNTVVLTVTDFNGNSATGTATVYIPDILIPSVGTITQPTLSVPSGSVALSNLPSVGTWTITQSPGGKTTTGTGTGTILTGLTPGTYTFTVSNQAGCTSGPSARVVIDLQPLQVTVNPGQGKIYGESDPALTYSFTPSLLDGDSFTGTLHRSTGETAGSYAIDAGTLSAGPRYSVTFIPDNFTITPKTLTVNGVTAANKVYDGTTGTTLSGGVLSGVVSGDDVTLVAGTGAFADKDAGTGKTIICSGYSLSGSAAGNYSLVQPQGVTADILKADPVITWSAPPAITYGTPLGSTQLNASANIPGTFTYTPGSGTVLNAGENQVLSVNFAPTDNLNYNPVNNTQVQITVNRATPVITWSNPSAIIYGTALSATQLNATASVPGTFIYTPGTGSILNAGVNQTLSANFTPTDNLNYNTVNSTQVQITVNRATPVITWNNPSAIIYGTALSATQLNATASVPGTFIYTPGTGTILNAGPNQILSADFTPGDNVNYNSVNNTQVRITVDMANQTINFTSLAERRCGDAPFNPNASASSGLTVNYTSSDPAVASISGNSVSIHSAGTTTITASQPGNTNYNAAVSVNQVLVVNTLDNSVTVTVDLLTANANGVTYQWINCNNGNSPVPGATNKTFTPANSGNYAVIVSNNGCSVSSACYSIVVTGVEKNDFEDNILVYPNPTPGNITIELGENYAKVEVLINDAFGRLSFRESYFDTRKIDLTINGSSGIYFVTVIKNGQKEIFKVIKR